MKQKIQADKRFADKERREAEKRARAEARRERLDGSMLGASALNIIV